MSLIVVLPYSKSGRSLIVLQADQSTVHTLDGVAGCLNPAGGGLECALSPEEDLTHLTYLSEGPPTFLSIVDGILRVRKSLGLLEGTIAACFSH